MTAMRSYALLVQLFTLVTCSYNPRDDHRADLYFEVLEPRMPLNFHSTNHQ